MEKLKVDEEKTIEKVDDFLSTYRDYALLADMEYLPKITASFSEELKSFGGGGNENGFESAIDRKTDAESHVKRVVQTIEQLPSELRTILYEKYISLEYPTDDIIYSRYHWSRATYYRKLRRARMSFARKWGKGPRLLQFHRRTE